MSAHDTVFGDAISRIYESHLVPLIFEPYAALTARRLSRFPATRVLEIAAGTGAVTRAMAARLPASVSITATDLNPAMLDQAARTGTARPVEWRQANAMSLPFADETFDAVVCQFGAMFFPDKRAAFAETRRVLRDGGVFLFSVWDRIEENEFADVVTTSVGTMFPDDPPRFLARTPHGYCDCASISREIAAAGFAGSIEIETVALRSIANSPRDPAVAYCEGTPMRNEIEARDSSALTEATALAASAIRERFGPGRVDGKIQAHVVTVAS
ncbi:MAG TPA: methyltransferase domain-containing protein [Gemmatimonadaceae bacterium]